MREKRERAGLAGDFADEQVDERAFDAQPARAGGLDDGFAQFVLGHRTEEQLLARDGGRERGVARAAAVEVGAHPDHDRTIASEQRFDEAGSLIVVVAEREELFELVDDEQRRRRRERPADAHRAS